MGPPVEAGEGAAGGPDEPGGAKSKDARKDRDDANRPYIYIYIYRERERERER